MRQYQIPHIPFSAASAQAEIRAVPRLREKRVPALLTSTLLSDPVCLRLDRYIQNTGQHIPLRDRFFTGVKAHILKASCLLHYVNDKISDL